MSSPTLTLTAVYITGVGVVYISYTHTYTHKRCRPNLTVNFHTSDLQIGRSPAPQARVYRALSVPSKGLPCHKGPQLGSTVLCANRYDRYVTLLCHEKNQHSWWEPGVSTVCRSHCAAHTHIPHSATLSIRQMVLRHRSIDKSEHVCLHRFITQERHTNSLLNLL